MRIQPFVSDASTRFLQIGPSTDVQSQQTSTSGPGATEQASSHVPSPELANLLGQLREQPDVRQDVLMQTAQRLANGYYDTSAAAQQTAAAMLQAPE